MSKVNSELKNILEAALLVSREPLSIEKMQTMFTEDTKPEKEEIRKALDALGKDYQGRGVMLKKIDKGYRFQSEEKYGDWIGRLTQERPPRYSRAMLETLSIIAYKQPVTRADIEDIRGVSVSTEIIRTMIDRDWVRQVGHRDVPGKPALYGTTKGFLEHFNLKSLDQLPPLSDLRDIEEISRELGDIVGAKPDSETPASADNGGDDAAKPAQAMESAHSDVDNEAEVVEMQAASENTINKYE